MTLIFIFNCCRIIYCFNYMPISSCQLVGIICKIKTYQWMDEKVGIIINLFHQINEKILYKNIDKD